MSTTNEQAQLCARLRAGVVALGAAFDPAILKATRDLYRPCIRASDPARVCCIRDIRWGADARQVLDLYAPAGASRCPVLLFVHGGGFVAGSKDEDGTFHRNVGEYFAHHGFVCLVPNYRLAPAHPWPAGALDVGGVLGWARVNAVEHGGDGEAIVAVGQSAGASHVAGWIFDDELRAGRESLLRGAALMSGLYRLRAPLAAGPLGYFGGDAAEYDRRSVAARVHKAHPPLLLTVAEYDPAGMAAQTFDLARELTLADGRPARLAWLEGHNHVSTVQSLGSPQDDVGQVLLRFVRECLRT
jgi:triacylglycerol lipase